MYRPRHNRQFDGFYSAVFNFLTVQINGANDAILLLRKQIAPFFLVVPVGEISGIP